MDRASTIRFYDHYGHASAAVCYQNTLHARTGDGRLDHALAPMSPGAGESLGLTPFLPCSYRMGTALPATTLAFARAVGREPVDLVGCSAHCTSV